MSSNVFGLFESTSFAKALAADQGVRVDERRQAVEPHVKNRKTIVLGTPSLHKNNEFMESLHAELSKVMEENQFFYDVEYPEDSQGEVIRRILQAQRSEYALNGVYAGRDRILRDRYSRRMRANGGVTEVARQIGTQNPIAGALMYLDNELRNDWQGYMHAECPEELKEQVDRLRPIVEDEWLQLNDKTSLETLIERIVNEQDTDGSGQGSDGEGSGSGDTSEAGGGSEGGEPREDEGAGQCDPDGEQSEGDDQSSAADDAGDGDPDAGAGEDDHPSDEGEEGSEGDAGDDQSSGSSGEQSGEGEGSSGDQPESGGGQSGEADGSDEELTKEEFQDEGEAEAGDFQGAKNLTGGGAATSLAEMGLVQDAVDVPEYEFEDDEAPYVPDNDFELKDLTKPLRTNQGTEQSIIDTLGQFSLSKKIRKYLISVSQVGYDYGLKRGVLCNKNISRIYAGHQQPRIFKKKQAARIKTDTAIFILGDCSGSMGGSPYYVSAASQIACSETLQGLKIPHMMGQFTTSHGIIHYVMKHFDENFVSRDKLIKRYADARLYMGANADGEAVVWAATQLAQRKEENKILIVLSDGYPAHTWGDRQFLKDVVEDIDRNSPMHMIGIGVQDDAVRHFYPDYRVVHELEDLEGVMLEMLREKVMA